MNQEEKKIVTPEEATGERALTDEQVEQVAGVVKMAIAPLISLKTIAVRCYGRNRRKRRPPVQIPSAVP